MTELKKQMKITFSELHEGSTEKTNVVVAFLAILESVKQGSILAEQMHRFEEIEIELEKSTKLHGTYNTIVNSCTRKMRAWV